MDMAHKPVTGKMWFWGGGLAILLALAATAWGLGWIGGGDAGETAPLATETAPSTETAPATE